MWTNFIFAVASIAAFTITDIQCQIMPPCDSPFRLLRPEFFTHCDCPYGDWSDWEVVEGSVVDVPKSQCPDTEQAYTERRERRSQQDGCSPLVETRQICLPDNADRLILLLGLGSSGQNVQPIVTFKAIAVPEITAPPFKVTSRGRRSIGCSSGLVCTDITEPRDKRSAEFISGERTSKKADVSSTESDSKPLAFNLKEHGKRLRRQSSSFCTDDPSTPKYVLFLLDTSGSIGTDNFERVKEALSRLVVYFCSPIQVAAMTFNHEYNLEFCFDCYDNDFTGRSLTADGINDIVYRSGWTHTGGAARCACDQMLHPSCGIPSTASCIDVVFVTDGKSNDPTKEICQEISCLHNRLGVNTYAIGIDNYDPDELACITKTSNSLNIFRFEDFDEFYNAILELEAKLNNDFMLGNFFACYDTSEAVP